MALVVQTPALAANGMALAAQPAPTATVPFAAAAPDPVSQSVAAILTSRAMALTVALAHGAAVRTVGGAALVGTSATFDTTDAVNAGLFTGQPHTGPAVSPAPAGAALPEPALPPLPSMAVPPAMPGEAFAALVHDGPGGSALREAAQMLRGPVAGALREQADETVAVGQAVNTNWQDDGRQPAGAHTVRHGTWLHHIADTTDALADAFDASADQHDRARENTPTPDEFRQARQYLLSAQARRDPVGMARAAADYSGLQSRAGEQLLTYHGEAAATTAALNTPIRTATAIAGGHGPAPGPDDTIVGGPNPRDPTIRLVDNRFGPLPHSPSPSPGPTPAPAPPAPTSPEPGDLSSLFLPPTNPQPKPADPYSQVIPGILDPTQCWGLPQPPLPPSSHPYCTDTQWRDAWLAYVGGFGALGVAPWTGPLGLLSGSFGAMSLPGTVDTLLACEHGPK